MVHRAAWANRTVAGRYGCAAGGRAGAAPMSTGAACAIFPTSSSCCIIRLIRAASGCVFLPFILAAPPALVEAQIVPPGRASRGAAGGDASCVGSLLHARGGPRRSLPRGGVDDALLLPLCGDSHLSARTRRRHHQATAGHVGALQAHAARTESSII